METHIKRRHGGTGQPIHKTPYGPLQSTGKPARNNWLGHFRKSSSPNTNDDPIDWQTLRKIKEIYELRSFLPPGLNRALPMNVDFSDGGTILGYNGHVCKKCLYLGIEQIVDDAKRTSLKFNHMCNPQALSETQLVTDISGMIYKRRQELIL